MTIYPTFKLSRLRDIGWTHWDPIGLGYDNGAWPEDFSDEYDQYLIEAALMLYRGRSIEEGCDYLIQVVSAHMGMSRVDKTAAFATAKALSQYIQELPRD